jgi:hypothetical protein
MMQAVAVVEVAEADQPAVVAVRLGIDVFLSYKHTHATTTLSSIHDVNCSILELG